MSGDKLRIIIPVKMSERLPFKHFLTLGGETLLNMAIRKAQKFGTVEIHSKMALPCEYIPDTGENIVDLLNKISSEGKPFLMIGPDMPFITQTDISSLLDWSKGATTVPVNDGGLLEPMFAFYAGGMEFSGSIQKSLANSHVKTIDTRRFSKYAFFNVNRSEDYSRAVHLFHSMVDSSSSTIPGR